MDNNTIFSEGDKPKEAPPVQVAKKSHLDLLKEECALVFEKAYVKRKELIASNQLAPDYDMDDLQNPQDFIEDDTRAREIAIEVSDFVTILEELVKEANKPDGRDGGDYQTRFKEAVIIVSKFPRFLNDEEKTKDKLDGKETVFYQVLHHMYTVYNDIYEDTADLVLTANKFATSSTSAIDRRHQTLSNTARVLKVGYTTATARIDLITQFLKDRKKLTIDQETELQGKPADLTNDLIRIEKDIQDAAASKDRDYEQDLIFANTHVEKALAVYITVAARNIDDDTEKKLKSDYTTKSKELETIEADIVDNHNHLQTCESVSANIKNLSGRIATRHRDLAEIEQILNTRLQARTKFQEKEKELTSALEALSSELEEAYSALEPDFKPSDDLDGKTKAAFVVAKIAGYALLKEAKAAEEIAKAAEETARVAEETARETEKAALVAQEATETPEKTSKVTGEESDVAEDETKITEEPAKVALEARKIAEEAAKAAVDASKRAEEARAVAEEAAKAVERDKAAGEESGLQTPTTELQAKPDLPALILIGKKIDVLTDRIADTQYDLGLATSAIDDIVANIEKLEAEKAVLNKELQTAITEIDEKFSELMRQFPQDLPETDTPHKIAFITATLERWEVDLKSSAASLQSQRAIKEAEIAEVEPNLKTVTNARNEALEIKTFITAMRAARVRQISQDGQALGAYLAELTHEKIKGRPRGNADNNMPVYLAPNPNDHFWRAMNHIHEANLRGVTDLGDEKAYALRTFFGMNAFDAMNAVREARLQNYEIFATSTKGGKQPLFDGEKGLMANNSHVAGALKWIGIYPNPRLITPESDGGFLLNEQRIEVLKADKNNIAIQNMMYLPGGAVGFSAYKGRMYEKGGSMDTRNSWGITKYIARRTLEISITAATMFGPPIGIFMIPGVGPFLAPAVFLTNVGIAIGYGRNRDIVLPGDPIQPAEKAVKGRLIDPNEKGRFAKTVDSLKGGYNKTDRFLVRALYKVTPDRVLTLADKFNQTDFGVARAYRSADQHLTRQLYKYTPNRVLALIDKFNQTDFGIVRAYKSADEYLTRQLYRFTPKIVLSLADKFNQTNLGFVRAYRATDEFLVRQLYRAIPNSVLEFIDRANENSSNKTLIGNYFVALRLYKSAIIKDDKRVNIPKDTTDDNKSQEFNPTWWQRGLGGGALGFAAGAYLGSPGGITGMLITGSVTGGVTALGSAATSIPKTPGILASLGTALAFLGLGSADVYLWKRAPLEKAAQTAKEKAEQYVQEKEDGAIKTAYNKIASRLWGADSDVVDSKSIDDANQEMAARRGGGNGPAAGARAQAILDEAKKVKSSPSPTAKAAEVSSRAQQILDEAKKAAPAPAATPPAAALPEATPKPLTRAEQILKEAHEAKEAKPATPSATPAPAPEATPVPSTRAEQILREAREAKPAAPATPAPAPENVPPISDRARQILQERGTTPSAQLTPAERILLEKENNTKFPKGSYQAKFLAEVQVIESPLDKGPTKLIDLAEEMESYEDIALDRLNNPQQIARQAT